jgi:hypothetical protein
VSKLSEASEQAAAVLTIPISASHSSSLENTCVAGSCVDGRHSICHDTRSKPTFVQVGVGEPSGSRVHMKGHDRTSNTGTAEHRQRRFLCCSAPCKPQRARPQLYTHISPPPVCCVCTAAAVSWLSYQATAPHAAITGAEVSPAQPSQARTTIALQAVGMRACGRHHHRQEE